MQLSSTRSGALECNRCTLFPEISERSWLSGCAGCNFNWNKASRSCTSSNCACLNAIWIERNRSYQMLPVGPVGQLAVLGFRISGFLRSFSSFSLLFCYQSWLFMNTVPQCIPLPLGYKHGRCCVSRSHSFAKLLVSAQLQKKSIVKFGGSAWPKSARGTVT